MSNILTRLLRPFTTSTSPMRFNPDSAAQNIPEGAAKCTLAAGCFWGVEHRYRHQFGGKGLYDAKVGYIGGDTKDPSYRSVCSGRTGHAEALQILYDPSQISYRQLIEYFYRMHDPTTLNSQGPDRGTQYRSAIFTHDAEQEATAKHVTELAQKQWYKNQEIKTQILPAGEWWDAEDYHQRYLEMNPGGYDCPTHFVRNYPALTE